MRAAQSDTLSWHPPAVCKAGAKATRVCARPHLRLLRARAKHAVEAERVLLAVEREREARAAGQAAHRALRVRSHAAEHADLAGPGVQGGGHVGVRSLPLHRSALRAGIARLPAPAHVAPQLHELVVQLPARALGRRRRELQRGHALQQARDDVDGALGRAPRAGEGFVGAARGAAPTSRA